MPSALSLHVRFLLWDFVESVRDFGVLFAVKTLLNLIGAKSYIKIRYPFSGHEVIVRTLPTWKRLESGKQEPNCIRLLNEMELEGKIVYDVGAAFGTYTLLLSKLVGQEGRVYAFEPDPKATEILRDNLSMNNLFNVQVEELCLSNRIGKAKLRANLFGVGVSSMTEFDSNNSLREMDVETLTVDKFCEINGTHPDGIKIDVEGAEGLVIEGCQETIKRYAPWILLEFHGQLMTEQERDRVWNLVSRNAKRMSYVEGYSRLYDYGNSVNVLPEVGTFRVFIQY